LKNTYYFPHDYHARHDPKLEKLFLVLGYEGVGIYWCLIEMLYEQGGYLSLKDLSLYSQNDKELCERITKVVNDYGLFEKDNTKLWSKSCLDRLAFITEKSEKASKSALKRWSMYANAMPTHNEGNAIKEKKVKEKKVKESIVANAQHTQEDFIKTLSENPAYKNLDLTAEFGKMSAWLSAHPGRKLTKRFAVNWLNRVEKPLEVGSKYDEVK